MRTKNIFYIFILFVFILPACKKEAGPGGKKKVEGTVYYKNGVTGSLEIANAASVHIAYGTKTATGSYDQTVQADASGMYHFDDLQKGDYYITAEFTDTHGFTYVTEGYAITIEKKKGELTVDIDLQ